MKFFPNNIGDIHFVGIGGIGMSGIAEVLHTLGYSVRGSDIKQTPIITRLQRLGVKVFNQQISENVIGASVVVVSSAIQADNPELQNARRLKIPVVKRAEMLSEIMKLKRSIAVAGTHGKTTTTSIISWLLEHANFSPTVINGGVINAYGSNAKVGNGEWIVVEADESDGSFLKLPSTIAVVTNIDRDHMENFDDFDDLRNRFLNFVEQIPFYGVGILCADHPEVQKVISMAIDRRIIKYGISKDSDVMAQNIILSEEKSVFDVVFSDKMRELYKINNLETWDNICIPMVGIHNVQNALAAIAVAVELGIDYNVCKSALASFSGVKRRFTEVGKTQSGAKIIDDYAHHPVEIQAVIRSAKIMCKKRLFVVVQLHRYSRLEALFSDFCEVFQQELNLNDPINGDHIFFTPIYPAGEKQGNKNHVSVINHLTQVNNCKNVNFVHNVEELVQKIKAIELNNDIVLFMGAGDITQWATRFCNLFDNQ